MGNRRACGWKGSGDLLDWLSAGMRRGRSFNKGDAAKRSLNAFSLHQVRLRVSHVIVDVAEDCFLVLLFQAASKFSRGAHPEGVRLDNRLLREQGTGGDNGSRSDDRALEDDGAHADKAASFDRAAVEDGVVSHCDIVAHVNAVLSFHAVEDGVVLNVGIMADTDVLYVAPEYGVHPDARVLADNDVAAELGGVVDVAGFRELGGDAFVGTDHGCLMPSAHSQNYHLGKKWCGLSCATCQHTMNCGGLKKDDGAGRCPRASLYTLHPRPGLMRPQTFPKIRLYSRGAEGVPHRG